MKTNNINIRIDPLIKQKTEIILNNLGLTLSDAINVFLHKVILEHGLPFEVKHQPRYNAETEAAFEEARQIMKNPSAYKGYTSVDEMFKEILAE